MRFRQRSVWLGTAVTGPHPASTPADSWARSGDGCETKDVDVTGDGRDCPAVWFSVWLLAASRHFVRWGSWRAVPRRCLGALPLPLPLVGSSSLSQPSGDTTRAAAAASQIVQLGQSAQSTSARKPPAWEQVSRKREKRPGREKKNSRVSHPERLLPGVQKLPANHRASVPGGRESPDKGPDWAGEGGSCAVVRERSWGTQSLPPYWPNA